MFRLILRFSVRILMNKKHHECLRTLQHSQLIHSVAADQLREIAFPYIPPAIPIQPGFLNKGLELRLHGFAHPPALCATTRPAKPRSHSDSREVKAFLVRLAARHSSISEASLTSWKLFAHIQFATMTEGCHHDFRPPIPIG